MPAIDWRASFSQQITMSEEESTSAEVPKKPATKVRRISNPRPRKQAKAKKPDSEEADASAEAPAPSETETPAQSPPSVVVAVDTEMREAPPSTESEESDSWSESEQESSNSSGAPAPGEAKRKRRRRKGKGSQSGPNQGNEEPHQISGEPSVGASNSASMSAQRPPQQGQRSQLDPKLLATKAWKIFLAEVSEEGVALITDQDARDLSRRCFKLAELFLEEQGRRR